MGLDITAWETAVKVDCQASWSCDHVQPFTYEGMERSMRGLDPGSCYAVSGESLSFRAGSYSGYGLWRSELAALGGRRESQYGPDSGHDLPFYEIVWFADNEGMIGPEAARDLHADFLAHRDEAARAMSLDYLALYDRWVEALEIAGRGGVVIFH